MKKTKTLISLLIILTLVFSLTGCGEISKAEATVNGMFGAFEELAFEEAQKFMNRDEVTPFEDQDAAGMEILIKSVFESLEHEIISSEKIDNSNVIVKTKITALDMKPVIAEFLSRSLEYALSNAFADPQPTEEETDAGLEEILYGCISKPDMATVSTEIDIKVIKNDENEWVIDADETLLNAILGGLPEAMSEL